MKGSVRTLFRREKKTFIIELVLFVIMKTEDVKQRAGIASNKFKKNRAVFFGIFKRDVMMITPALYVLQGLFERDYLQTELPLSILEK
jgi:hypothetical protein